MAMMARTMMLAVAGMMVVEARMRLALHWQAKVQGAGAAEVWRWWLLLLLGRFLSRHLAPAMLLRRDEPVLASMRTLPRRWQREDD